MKLPRALRLDRRRILSLLRYVVVAGLAVLATVVVGFAIQARLRLPPLQLWHRAPLTAEYRVDAADAPQRFEDYLQQEARLFAQLDQVIADAAITEPVSRFNPQSAPGQLARAERANRSYELLPAEPTGAVLLVHGLSDSPYSMHALADWYFARGFYVLSLRLPGHGTMPSGLLDVRWQDWYGAVMLAAKHAAARTHGGPLHLCGYSTGAALVALLATRSLADDTLPRPDRLVLLSAAIGVSPFAALANVASTLACVPYFETADWLDVLPEYDPYKYNSFPVNAGNQIYRLTGALREELAQNRARLGEMPRILAFQSVIDATVSAADLVEALLLQLPEHDHELVAFDINRSDGWASLAAPSMRDGLQRIEAMPALPFDLRVIGNATPAAPNVAAFVRPAGSRETTVEALDLAWPEHVFSLGHVALPFPIDDPVYGLRPRQVEGPRWPLGQDVARGEAGANTLPFSSLARLRCNPFFAVIEQRLAAAVEHDRR